MEKIKIRIVTLGHAPKDLNLNLIADWESRIFSISPEIESYELRNKADIIKGWAFSDLNITECLPSKGTEDILIAIANVPLEDNWYSRRIGTNTIVITLHEIRDFLRDCNIPLHNVIMRLVYAYSLFYIARCKSIPSCSEEHITSHDETRCCIYDFNGIKSEVIYSCDKPIICSECKEKLKRKAVSNDVIDYAESEIKAIQKPLYFRGLDYIKVHPVKAFVISSLYALLLGTLSSIMASMFYTPN